MRRPAAALVVVAAGVVTALLVTAMLDLPPAAVTLPAAVAGNLEASGVAHPVTAVLLNFRGYDTLMEVGVLLLALLGVLAASTARPAPATSPSEPVLRTLAGLGTPLMVLAAGYLLWAGAHRPGGAFQAAAVLAAAAVLLHLSGRLHGWAQPGRRLRAGLAAGFLVFLAIAATTLAQGPLLAYPAGQAGALIFAIEATLTLSLGLVLAGLFLFLTDSEGRRR